MFGILLKLILALIPKHDLTLVICSPIIQIYKNIWCQEAFVSKVKTQLNAINLPSGKFPEIA
jgi:hypothetical protein